MGKAFRNEITTGNFIFRSREFEQMELEFFVKPGTDKEWFDHWLEERFNWYTNLGIKKENLRFHPHTPEELPHYARKAYDIQYHFVWVTKYRYPVLQGEVAKRARELIRQSCMSRDIKIVRGHVSKDHIHILVSCPPTLSPAKVMQ